MRSNPAGVKSGSFKETEKLSLAKLKRMMKRLLAILSGLAPE
jgi:hypothetical protein